MEKVPQNSTEIILQKSTKNLEFERFLKNYKNYIAKIYHVSKRR